MSDFGWKLDFWTDSIYKELNPCGVKILQLVGPVRSGREMFFGAVTMKRLIPMTAFLQVAIIGAMAIGFLGGLALNSPQNVPGWLRIVAIHIAGGCMLYFAALIIFLWAKLYWTRYLLSRIPPVHIEDSLMSLKSHLQSISTTDEEEDVLPQKDSHRRDWICYVKEQSLIFYRICQAVASLNKWGDARGIGQQIKIPTLT